MTAKQKIILGASALAVSFAAGRWATPVKVRVETKTVEVERKTTDTKSDLDLNKHKETVTTTSKRPDGTVETTTKTTEDTHANRSSDQQTTDQTRKTASVTKETTYSTSKVTISALGGISVHDMATPIYGASVTKPVMGPITLGAFGFTNGTFGLSVGISL